MVQRAAVQRGDGLLAFPAPQLRETPLAAAAYANYESLGEDRSLEKLVEWYRKRAKSNREEGLPDTYIPSLSTLKRWSNAHHWQARLRTYEDAQLEKRRKKRQADLEKMDEEHALIGRTHLLRAVRAMEPLLEQNQAPFPSLVSLFRFSAELERLARGAATARMEGEIGLVVQPKEYLNIDPDEEGSEP